MSVAIPASDKRKSLVLTVIIYAVILVILFFIRFWPPSNTTEMLLAGGGGGGGVTVNFGDTDFGSGNNFENKALEVKNETVIGIIGNTQGVSKAANPPIKPAIKMPQKDFSSNGVVLCSLITGCSVADAIEEDFSLTFPSFIETLVAAKIA